MAHKEHFTLMLGKCKGSESLFRLAKAMNAIAKKMIRGQSWPKPCSICRSINWVVLKDWPVVLYFE